MHLSVLNRKQKELLKKIGFLKKYGFYLAGLILISMLA